MADVDITFQPGHTAQLFRYKFNVNKSIEPDIEPPVLIRYFTFNDTKSQRINHSVRAVTKGCDLLIHYQSNPSNLSAANLCEDQFLFPFVFLSVYTVDSLFFLLLQILCEDQ